jgi:transposase
MGTRTPHARTDLTATPNRRAAAAGAPALAGRNCTPGRREPGHRQRMGQATGGRGLRALRRHKSGGRPARMTRTEKQTLVHTLKRRALVAGFPSDRWTTGRVRQLIDREFGLRYHVKCIPRLLAALGWRLQLPLPRAAERDEELIRAWLAWDLPRIKRSAAPRRGRPPANRGDAHLRATSA